MKLQAEINQEKHEVILNRENNKIFAEIDGRKYELESDQIEPNVFLFKLDGKIFECHTSAFDKSGVSNVQVKNNHFEVKIVDPKRLRGSSNSDLAADGIAKIITQMPGKVVRLLVEEGAEVVAGQGVIIVEAMKMQNEMKSPKDGTVTEILASEGGTVNSGDVLLVIE